MLKIETPTILFLSELSDDSWPSALAEAFPAFQVATRLEDADPATTVAALVWKHPSGSLRTYSNLRVIINLSAGVDHIVGDPDLPPGVPIARLADPELTARMSEYVLLHCLSLHRGLPELRIAQSERHWNFAAPNPPSTACVGILGFDRLGRACADQLSRIGFGVIGCKRFPAEDEKFEILHGPDGLSSSSRGQISSSQCCHPPP